jgi:hypothetical protein
MIEGAMPSTRLAAHRGTELDQCRRELRRCGAIIAPNTWIGATK